jgi:acetyltransferase-like isoleucine patch superfamily enzyme
MKNGNSLISLVLKRIYGIQKKWVRNLVLKALLKFEGGQFYSTSIREVFKKYHHVDIGMYTHGGCFIPGNFDKHTTIGRYSSIAMYARSFNRNHPTDFKSMHAFFFNSCLDYCKKDLIEYIPLTVGNDVWIGHGAIILPNVQNIGTGSVIGAGSIITKDVQPYSIVAGNPATEIKKRFSDHIIKELLESKWWNKSIDEIKPFIRDYHGIYKKVSK